MCSNSAVFTSPAYCHMHFNEYFEKKVIKTITRFGLFKKSDRIMVAVSGGKDSLTILNILHKFGYDVTAIAIDEGISGYRSNTLAVLKKFCKSKKIKLKIVSFKNSFGSPLDDMSPAKNRPCAVCGVLRRYLLNLSSKEFDVVATGHNLDDEAQAVLMNLIKNNLEILQRQGPVSGNYVYEGFRRKAKPLYFCHEKEVMTYSFLNKLNSSFIECPNVSKSFRLRIRDLLNTIESSYPGTKKNIIDWFLMNKSSVVLTKTKKHICKNCGEPSSHLVCNTCKLLVKIKNQEIHIN